MTGSRPQLARLLALIPYLQARPGITVGEAATDFGVSQAQLRKDLAVLWFCGLPGQAGGDLIDVDMDAVDARGVIHLSNAEYLARPLRLTSDEAFSLALALKYLGDLSDSATRRSVTTALEKVRAAMPRDAVEIATASVITASPAVRDAVAAAITEGQRLDLCYDGPHRCSTPRVDPARVVEVRGVAYLQAYSLPRQAWRTYRMERITAATFAGEPATPHGEPPVVPDDWGEVLPFTSQVTLRVPRRHRWVAEYYPTRQVTATADGYEIELGVTDETWLRRLLLRLGGDAVVVEPASAAEGARSAARSCLQRYARLEQAAR